MGKKLLKNFLVMHFFMFGSLLHGMEGGATAETAAVGQQSLHGDSSVLQGGGNVFAGNRNVAPTNHSQALLHVAPIQNFEIVNIERIGGGSFSDYLVPSRQVEGLRGQNDHSSRITEEDKFVNLAQGGIAKAKQRYQDRTNAWKLWDSETKRLKLDQKISAFLYNTPQQEVVEKWIQNGERFLPGIIQMKGEVIGADQWSIVFNSLEGDKVYTPDNQRKIREQWNDFCNYLVSLLTDEEKKRLTPDTKKNPLYEPLIDLFCKKNAISKEDFQRQLWGWQLYWFYFGQPSDLWTPEQDLYWFYFGQPSDLWTPEQDLEAFLGRLVDWAFDCDEKDQQLLEDMRKQINLGKWKYFKSYHFDLVYEELEKILEQIDEDENYDIILPYYSMYSYMSDFGDTENNALYQKRVPDWLLGGSSDGHLLKNGLYQKRVPDWLLGGSSDGHLLKNGFQVLFCAVMNVCQAYDMRMAVVDFCKKQCDSIDKARERFFADSQLGVNNQVIESLAADSKILDNIKNFKQNLGLLLFYIDSFIEINAQKIRMLDEANPFLKVLLRFYSFNFQSKQAQQVAAFLENSELPSRSSADSDALNLWENRLGQKTRILDNEREKKIALQKEIVKKNSEQNKKNDYNLIAEVEKKIDQESLNLESLLVKGEAIVDALIELGYTSSAQLLNDALVHGERRWFDFLKQWDEIENKSGRFELSKENKDRIQKLSTNVYMVANSCFISLNDALKDAFDTIDKKTQTKNDFKI